MEELNIEKLIEKNILHHREIKDFMKIIKKKL